MSVEWEFGLNFDEMRGRVAAAYPIAVGRGAEHLRGVAVPLTPILSGDLRGGAGVTVNGSEAAVTFKGPYARYQHYGLDFAHPQGGQALFLEQPVITEASKVTQIIADTLGDAL